MKTKKFDLGVVKLEMEFNGFAKGLILKRDVSLRECKHIMRNLLGIDINGRDCFNELWEYKEYNENLVRNVNDWLKGNFEDTALMHEYAIDCYDEPIGIMNLVPIIKYLKTKDIIE